MRKLTFLMSLFLMVFFSCEKEGLIGEDSITRLKNNSREAQMVPFTGEFIQNICDNQLIPCSISGVFFPKYICMEGRASQLGRVTDAQVEVLNCGPGEEPGSLTGETMGYFVSANGDTLKFSGISTVYADGTGSGQHLISGGSGRFEYACGEFEVSSYYDGNGVNYGSIYGHLCNLGRTTK